jgi:hypothetical protein
MDKKKEIYCPNDECKNNKSLDPKGAYCPMCGTEYAYYGAPTTSPKKRRKEKKGE